MGLSSIITSTQLAAASPAFAALDSALQTVLWNGACSVADSYIGRDLAASAATEYYDGSKDRFLNLKRWPVTVLTEVKYDLTGGYGQASNTFGSDTILTIGTDFYCDYNKGILQLIRNLSSGANWFSKGYTMPVVQGNFSRGLVASYFPASWGQIQGCVKVTYTAGYSSGNCPSELVSALAQIAVYLSKINDTGGLVQSKVSYIDVSQGFEVTQAVDALRGGIPALGTSRQILDNYRSPVVGSGWILT